MSRKMYIVSMYVAGIIVALMASMAPARANEISGGAGIRAANNAVTGGLSAKAVAVAPTQKMQAARCIGKGAETIIGGKIICRG